MSRKKNNANMRTDDPNVQDGQTDFQESVPDGYKEYTVLTDGAIIGGELLNNGDVVVLHPLAASVLMDADVRLTEVKSV